MKKIADLNVLSFFQFPGNETLWQYLGSVCICHIQRKFKAQVKKAAWDDEKTVFFDLETEIIPVSEITL